MRSRWYQYSQNNSGGVESGRDCECCGGRWSRATYCELSRRRAAMANTELCAELLADAQRRGQTEIDWAEYFRNSGMY